MKKRYSSKVWLAIVFVVLVLPICGFSQEKLPTTERTRITDEHDLSHRSNGLFVSNDSETFANTDPYAIYESRSGNAADFFISFNLDTQQEVSVEVIDIRGQLVACQKLEDVLDQTYAIEAAHRSTGLYIIRLLINNHYYKDKVYLTQ